MENEVLSPVEKILRKEGAMRNILALDGGGTRGIFSLQILAKMEQLLRDKFNRPEMVLADHFDFIGGTSTGAIIAAALSWGVPVAEIEAFYLDQSRKVFSRKTLWDRLRSKYHAEELSNLLREFFSVDGKPATLGTDRMRTLYLCVMRNASTGSAWIMTNNPRAKFNRRGKPDKDGKTPPSNLDMELYKLIRASTAAPIFFRPENLSEGDQSWLFLDGAVTPYNNPAFMLYLLATLPCYNLNWPEGEDKMRIISVGTGRVRIKFAKTEAAKINVLDQASHAVLGLIDSNNQHQDLSCRAVGRCLFGEDIDSEIEALVDPADQEKIKDVVAAPPTLQVDGESLSASLREQAKKGPPRRFVYCRYNHNLTPDEIKRIAHVPDFFSVDNLRAIDFLKELGTQFAEENVKIHHLV
jgi:hypothetical protein